MDEFFQFYPTPAALGERAWALFKDKDFNRVLEPEAGSGSLVRAMPHADRYGHYQGLPIDCIEMSIEHHPALREMGCTVLGMDFMAFEKGSQYSHIIMNPPFAQGAQHVLHAWDILWHGEIVAIVNAETLRNPYTRERQLLVNLIEDHGSFEYVEAAFSNAARQTEVEVALIHLEKKADSTELLGTILSDLKGDRTSFDDIELDKHQDLAIPNSSIDNFVLAFEAAWISIKDQVKAESRAAYYERLLGKTLAQKRGEAAQDKDRSAEWVRQELQKRYVELKDRAWANVLDSTDIKNRLSQKVRNEVDRRFEEIRSLDFTTSNIRNFLMGLVENQSKLQVEMACDVFDQIVRYHTDNRVHYRGWKSNDKHRTCGMRIKKTRFILPHFSSPYGPGLSFEAKEKLADFDKVFAMLDGNPQAHHYGLVDLFDNHLDELKAGERLSCDFFDVRYYPGIGTVHFFPGKRQHIDRLNMIVGREREWLPPEDVRVHEDFWLQYEESERFDKMFRKRIKQHPDNQRSWTDPLRSLVIEYSQEEQELAGTIVDEVLTEVQLENGIDIDARLDHKSNDDPALEGPDEQSVQSDLFVA